MNIKPNELSNSIAKGTNVKCDGVDYVQKQQFVVSDETALQPTLEADKDYRLLFCKPYNAKIRKTQGDWDIVNNAYDFQSLSGDFTHSFVVSCSNRINNYIVV